MVEKQVATVVSARKGTLCYVRVRCPCCGMWARLDNLKRDHVLYEECSTYSGGRASLFHSTKINPALQAFWINRLTYVLERMGVKKKHDVEIPLPYGGYFFDQSRPVLESGIGYSVELGGEISK